MSDFQTIQLELTRIRLAPGEVLAVTIKSDEASASDFAILESNLKLIFPNNKVMLFVMAQGDDVSFTAIKDADSCGPQTCVDCNCGKKESMFKTDVDLIDLINQGESK